MIRTLIVALPLLAAMGQHGRAKPTAVVIVRTPGAIRADSALIAAAVTKGLTADSRVEVLAPGASPEPGMKAARYTIEVTAKAIGRVGLVDARAVNTASHTLVARVSLRALAGALPDSAEVAARRLAAKIAPGRPE